MTDYSDPLFRKLDRIPGAPNFVRYNFEELIKTTKAYVQFAKGMPTVSYAAGITLVKDLVLGIIDAEQARKAAQRLKESPSKKAVIEFVKAFCLYAESRQYRATPSYSDFSAFFPIGRDLFIPVKPTLVAREDGQLKPVFAFGWKSVPLTTYQRRLLMTILEDAIFSLTDFESSDAEIVFLPEVNGVRTPEVWHRGDYELLSPVELRNQLEVFLSAREAAYPIIADWLKTKRKPAPVAPTVDEAEQPRLDLRLPPPAE
ncbi:hypothetical protein [Sphingomonas bacterium]|uniref:hypothetical protein n=1 Tax=Sphingomonas bacterium TaxID=1895847 RepID=UPI002637A772|nr:hypothetical protein [Sphingomonas bacterium]MDB5679630.1 hypothetical protein [Sphingomonas bacterium]